MQITCARMAAAARCGRPVMQRTLKHKPIRHRRPRKTNTVGKSQPHAIHAHDDLVHERIEKSHEREIEHRPLNQRGVSGSVGAAVRGSVVSAGTAIWSNANGTETINDTATAECAALR